MTFEYPNILYYTACLLMMSVCVYGALVKIFHVCPQYKANYSQLFPASRLLNIAMIMHLLFIPYLLNVGTELGVRYATTLLLVTHPFIYSLLIDYAFFLNRVAIARLISFGILVGALIILPAMYYIEENDMITPQLLRYARALPTIIFVIELFYIVSPIRKLTVKIAMHNRQRYSSDKDFPFPFAYVTLIPINISTFYIVVMYFMQSEAMLMGFNLFLTISVGALAIHTMTPLRDYTTISVPSMSKNKNDVDISSSEPEGDSNDENKLMPDVNMIESFDGSMNIISPEEKKILDDLEIIMKEKQLFKLSYLKITDVYPIIGVSRLMLTNAIAKSEYGSFYNMVNSYRLNYAQNLMSRMADFKLQDISIEAGFSSQSQFNQFFKEMTGSTPTKWLHRKRKMISKEEE